MPIGTRRAAARKAVKTRRWRKPPLNILQILAWADAHHEETGQWPTTKSGRVRGTLEERWRDINAALRVGLRTLPGGDSLPRLLDRFRGVRNRKALPPYTIDQILGWADAYYQRHGRWPLADAGKIADAPGETWTAVQIALSHGRRGLPGGSSLAQLLAVHRGRRNKSGLPAFKISTILKWADAHRQRTGMWPTHETGLVADAPDETWRAVDKALRNGTRGLHGGSSLARLLQRHRRVPLKQRRKSPLSIDMILAWADAHQKRTGDWPDGQSGAVPESSGETWGKVRTALIDGDRGLKGGSSLAKLLAEHRGVRNVQDLPDFTIKQILAWADAHYERHGRWPGRHTGGIEDAPGETWNAVNLALSRGLRGLPGGTSLPRLLAKKRGARNRGDLPNYSTARILAWADAYRRRTGIWPKQTSGKVAEAPGESWGVIDTALRKGRRGLPKGLALGKLWAQYRGVRNVHSIAKFTPEQILKWADAHYRRTGTWPQVRTGPIAQSPTDNWLSVENALRVGLRGLPGGSSLKRFLDEHRRNGQVAIAKKQITRKKRRAARSSPKKPR